MPESVDYLWGGYVSMRANYKSLIFIADNLAEECGGFTVPSIKICIPGNSIAAPQSSGFMVSCVWQEDT